MVSRQRRSSPGEGGGLSGDNVNSTATIPDAAVKPITHADRSDGGRRGMQRCSINGVRVSNVLAANLGRGKVIVIGMTGSGRRSRVHHEFPAAPPAANHSTTPSWPADARRSTAFCSPREAIRSAASPNRLWTTSARYCASTRSLLLTIEGHTDNAGAAASNQTLSDKRAAAVRLFLISHYQIDASRLVSKGFYATKAVASNDTPEGRQQNRRVDLVKN